MGEKAMLVEAPDADILAVLIDVAFVTPEIVVLFS